MAPGLNKIKFNKLFFQLNMDRLTIDRNAVQTKDYTLQKLAPFI